MKAFNKILKQDADYSADFLSHNKSYNCTDELVNLKNGPSTS